MVLKSSDRYFFISVYETQENQTWNRRLISWLSVKILSFTKWQKLNLRKKLFLNIQNTGVFQVAQKVLNDTVESNAMNTVSGVPLYLRNLDYVCSDETIIDIWSTIENELSLDSKVCQERKNILFVNLFIVFCIHDPLFFL